MVELPLRDSNKKSLFGKCRQFAFWNKWNKQIPFYIVRYFKYWSSIIIDNISI